MPTAGGGLAKLMFGASVQLGPALATGLEFGRLWAADSALRAPVTQWWLSLALEPAPDAGGERRGTLALTEWTPSVQHYVRAARRDGGTRSLDTVGLKLARQMTEHVYGTAQAHSAFAGGAGAYSVGLVGAGLTTQPRPQPWRAGAELLVGAAGGGGVASGGGAIAQGLGWVGLAVAPELELRVGAGALRSRREGLSTPVFEISVTRSFGQLAR